MGTFVPGTATATASAKIFEMKVPAVATDVQATREAQRCLRNGSSPQQSAIAKSCRLIRGRQGVHRLRTVDLPFCDRAGDKVN